jgi:predicted DNA-binding transcriptional regulator YafY
MFLEIIKKSARERRILKIYYRDKDSNEIGWRYIEPYSFTYDDGEEGLFAWDISKDGIRRFSLDRIDKLEITEQFYSPRYEIKI